MELQVMKHMEEGWILGIGQRIAVEHIISGMRYPQHGSAIEMLEAELWDLSAGKAPSAQLVSPATELLIKQEMDVVRVDHTALALSKTFIIFACQILQVFYDEKHQIET
ncbi:uncharacterized protein LOC131217202 isoform X2 [Magnolia sinica]|uniref:uncharacterized protein LOC131217202 isoform X2 n=1 Tax=Magnolia sinica TaxID=86752 RepID=UPI002657DF3C|nr:uncharacterized protein LOC131217202 isoform X2 [Magnolia sinica]